MIFSFPNLEYNNRPITLLQLSNHTSGIPSQLCTLPENWNSFTIQEKYLFKKQYTKNLFLQDLQKTKLDKIPGYEYNYSNAGFKLLSIILEEIYKMPYEKLIDKYITRKLKMPATKVFPEEKDWRNFAVGTQDINLLKSTKDINDYTSGPSLISNLSDMLKYLSLNINGKDKSFLLTHKTSFTDSADMEIGLAWRIAYTTDGDKYYYHSGSGWGCNSIILFSPFKNVGVIIFVNEKNDQKKLIDVAMNILDQLYKINDYTKVVYKCSK